MVFDTATKCTNYATTAMTVLLWRLHFLPVAVLLNDTPILVVTNGFTFTCN